MLDTKYMDNHNISNFKVDVVENKFLRINITFKNNDKLHFDIEEGLIPITLPSTVMSRIEEYEIQIRRKKILKLKKL